MFEKVLIANRGEIALRVARACRELGIKSRGGLLDRRRRVRRRAASPTRPSASARRPAGKSYLHIPNIIGAAQKTGADAIHPGYGFLSEDPYFAEICADNGITFIGPEARGDGEGRRQGDRARPDVEGRPAAAARARSSRSAPSDEAQEIADEIGYPVIIKAVAGGGGRGMNVVRTAPRTSRALYQTTRATAQAVFKDSAVYIERYLEAPRHTEVQLVCDGHGNGVYFFERDCSVQRRHQKLIEEAPSIHLTDEQRAATSASAPCAGALSVGYTGAGHDGVPARRRRQPQLHGDERPHPGRAPGERDDHRAST